MCRWLRGHSGVPKFHCCNTCWSVDQGQEDEYLMALRAESPGGTSRLPDSRLIARTELLRPTSQMTICDNTCLWCLTHRCTVIEGNCVETDHVCRGCWERLHESSTEEEPEAAATTPPGEFCPYICPHGRRCIRPLNEYHGTGTCYCHDCFPDRHYCYCHPCDSAVGDSSQSAALLKESIEAGIRSPATSEDAGEAPERLPEDELPEAADSTNPLEVVGENDLAEEPSRSVAPSRTRSLSPTEPYKSPKRAALGFANG